MSFSNPPAMAKEAATEYRRALLDLLADRDPIDVLTSTQAALLAAFAGTAPDRINQPEVAGKWSMLGVARHLADAEVFEGKYVLNDDVDS